MIGLSLGVAEANPSQVRHIVVKATSDTSLELTNTYA